MSVEMVLRPLMRRVRPSSIPSSTPNTTSSSFVCLAQQYQRRHASTETSSYASDASSSSFAQDLETASSLASTSASKYSLSKYDPVARAAKRNRQLPPSRYKFRPPKYYRGPLHPHQPPPPSDPSSRLFIPGPFTLPRLQQTYDSTLAADLMTLSYQHYPPGYQAPTKSARLRKWEGDSPYYANRPLRGPRGSDVLRLLRQPVTFRNIPRLEKVTVHTFVKGALTNSAHLHVAGMVVQAITNVRAEPHQAKQSLNTFGIRKGQYLAVTAELKGEDMLHFLSKCIDVVMPRIKDYKGVKGSSGDSSGNIGFGFTAEEVALFPEVEVNYDAYPQRMIPGCHVVVHTTATNDRDARLLLTSIGIPFFGKQIN